MRPRATGFRRVVFALALVLGAAACGGGEPTGGAGSEAESESESEAEGEGGSIGGGGLHILLFDLIETPEPDDSTFDVVLDLFTWDAGDAIEPQVRNLLPPGRAVFRFDLASQCVTLLEAGGTFPSGALHCGLADSETGCAVREVEIADPPARINGSGVLLSADCACDPGYVVALEVGLEVGFESGDARLVGASLMNPEVCDVPECFWMESKWGAWPADYNPQCDATLLCADYPWCDSESEAEGESEGESESESGGAGEP